MISRSEPPEKTAFAGDDSKLTPGCLKRRRQTIELQDYLLALLEGEVMQRDEHAQKLRLARARFPVIKSLDNFDFTAFRPSTKPWC